MKKQGNRPQDERGDSDSQQNARRAKRKKSRATLQADSLEARIMMSATWVDADAGDDLESSEGAETVSDGDVEDLLSGLDGDDGLFGDDGDDNLFGGDDDAAPVLTFTETFSNGDFEGWEPISLGNDTYDWSVNEDGELQERSNSGNGFLSYDMSQQGVDTSSATNYSISATIDANTGDTYNNGVGFVFGYEDNDNYYKVSWNDYSTSYESSSAHKDFTLVKVEGGQQSTLDSIDHAELPDEFELTLDVDPKGGITVMVDGEAQLSASGESPAIETFGLYTRDNDLGVSYDDVRVEIEAEDVASETLDPEGDGNHAPTDLKLVGTSIREDAEAGTVVGELRVADEDVARQVVEDGLVARWTFDEAGDAGGDVSGNDFDGLLRGGATTDYEEGRGDVAVLTDGNDYLQLEQSIDLGEEWSITAEFEGLNDTGTWATLARGSQGDHQMLVHPSTGELGTYDNVNGTGFHGAGFNMRDLDEGWHSVTAVGKGGETVFYVDGQEVGTADYQSTSNVTSIGNHLGGGNQRFADKIDDVQIHDRALDPDEIAATHGHGDRFTFEVQGENADLFEMDGNKIVVKEGAEFDFDQADSHGVTVRVTDAAGESYEETITVDLTQVTSVLGDEDSPIEIPLSSSFASGQPVTVSGVPEGAALSAGTDNGDGTWTLQADELEGLTVTPPANSHGDFELTFTGETGDADATGQEGESISEIVQVEVAAVNDEITDLTILGGSVAENATEGTVVAQIQVHDADVGSTPLIADGLEARFTFDESGNVGRDVTGNGYDASLQKGAALDIDADHSGVVDFSDGNDFLQLGQSIDLGEEWTISAEFEGLNESGTWATLTRGSQGDHQVLAHPSTGELGTYDNVNGTGFHGSGFSLRDLDSGWHNITAVGSGGQTTFFVDGEEVGTADYQSTSNITSVGNHLGGGNQRFADSLDDVQIHNRALDPSEIAKLHSTGDTYTYELSGESADKFEMDGNKIVVKEGATLDFEQANQHEVTVTVTDSAGHAIEQTITIDVENVNDAPTITEIESLTVTTDEPLSLTFDQLLASSDAADQDGEIAGIRIDSVQSGTVTVNGEEVVPGETIVRPGDQLEWTPDDDALGTQAAFRIAAVDDEGVASSEPFDRDSGLVAHWSFDHSGDGTTVVDDSGNGNDARMLKGASVGDQATGDGAAGQFVDGNDYMQLEQSIDLGESWTISTEFQGLNDSGTWATLSRGSEGDHQLLVHPATGELGTYDNVHGTGFHGSGFNLRDLDDGWHKLTAVGADGSTTFFVDGEEVGTSDYQSTSNVTSIGNHLGGGNQRFADAIDDVRIFDRALSADEVSLLHADENPGVQVNVDVVEAAVVEAAELQVQDALGSEDSTIPLNISAALSEANTEQAVSITISGVPEGASLSAGTDNGDGSWMLQPDQLEGLQVNPAANSDADFTLEVTATTQDADGSTATVSDTIDVTVEAVADAATLEVADAVGSEDGAIALDISSALTDADGSETLAVTISGVPEGASLSAGTDNGDGTWTLQPDQLEGLQVNPAANSDADFTLEITATTQDADGSTATVSDTIDVTVEAVADAATLAVADAAGSEDSAIALDISSALTDADGSETLSVTISGVPEGASLSAGTYNGDGTWTLQPDQLDGLQVNPAANSDADFTLEVTATTQDADGSTATVSDTIDVTVAAVADAATLEVADAVGSEDSAIALDISSALTDADGSETLAVTISGAPEGASLSAGTDNGDGSWTLQPDQLEGLQVNPAANSDADFTLEVTATTQDADGSTATVSDTIDVTVAAVADAATLEVADAVGSEDSAIALDISSALTDADGSETLAVTISGVPEGASLSAGTDNGDGTWTLQPDQLEGLQVNPAANSDADFTLEITATTQDADGSTATVSDTIDVTVAAVADAATLEVADAVGSEDGAIALDISSALTDADGSETLAVTISGVPEGASLSAGTDNGDGTWTLAPDQLDGLQVNPAANSDADFTLEVTATTQDADGSTATVSDTIDVTVAAVADAATLEVADAVGSEDSAIALGISSALTDADDSETLAVTISGVPEGASLSTGTDNGDGTWTLQPDQLEGLQVNPAANSDADFTLEVTATTQDADGSTATVSDTIDVTVAAVADAATLEVADAVGSEDNAIALDISSALTDADGSETLAVTISGVPEGASLSAGTDNGDGTWTLQPDQLDGLQVNPAANSDADFTLEITATTQDADGSTATVSDTIDVTVAAVADAATLEVADAVGSEDSAIALDISSALTDADGSETLAVTISGVPEGASLSAGTDNRDGTWTLQPDQLDGLQVNPAANSDADFTLEVTATTQDADGSTVTVSDTIDVTVAAVADAATLEVADAVGSEDGAIALDISSALTDADGSETLAVTISGVPEGASLSAGTDNGDGTWTLQPDQLEGLQVNPAANSDADFTLEVTATTQDADGSTATVSDTIDVTVEAVADAATLEVNSIRGPVGESVAFNILASLNDLDGSEQVSIRVEGLPAEAVLSAGEQQSDGTWVLEAGDLEGLTLQVPVIKPGGFEVEVTAIVTDGEGATTEVHDTIDLDIQPTFLPSGEIPGESEDQPESDSESAAPTGQPVDPNSSVRQIEEIDSELDRAQALMDELAPETVSDVEGPQTNGVEPVENESPELELQSGLNEPTDWASIDLGEIREIPGDPELTDSDSIWQGRVDGAEEAEYAVHQETESEPTAAPQGRAAWLWSLVRAYGGTRKTEPDNPTKKR